ncbi:MAG: DoxX family protein [Silicimonas sp.]|nr:DoxX family protein [Silicimonas sp.]
MEIMGVPRSLLPIVIAVEFLGGVAVLVGFQARIAGFLPVGFTVIAGTTFHLVPMSRGPEKFNRSNFIRSMQRPDFQEF